MSGNVMIGTGGKADRLMSNPIKIENENIEKGMADLKKGQIITGTVVEAEEKVTLDFNGQKVTTSRQVLKNAVPGEKKIFEVVKASEKEIELRLLDGTRDNNRKTFKAFMVPEADLNTILSQKEQTARRVSRETEVLDTKNKMEEIASKLTELDCRLLEQEGFPIETFSINGLYDALSRIKAGIAENSKPSDQTKISDRTKISDQTKKESAPVMPSVLINTSDQTSAFDEKALRKRLREENLPVTSDNLTKLSNALKLSDTAVLLDDKAMKYLIGREVEPTIENLYKAFYSGTAKNQEKPQKLTSQAWEELKGQVEEVITAAGFEVNEDSLKASKWLLENKLPLTKETLEYKKKLGEIKSNSDKKEILDKLVSGMKEGIAPKDVSLLTQTEVSYERLIADVNSIREETITHAVKEGLEISIKRLVTIQESLAERKNVIARNTIQETAEVSDNDNRSKEPQETEIKDIEKNISIKDKDPRLEEIRVKRQLEEIRLKMTTEAAAKLEKKGIKIETQKLEKVVEELRELEDNYYKDLLKEAEVEVLSSSVQQVKETAQSVEILKQMPCDILGSTLTHRKIQTVSTLLAEGTKLKAEYSKAGTAYETLMTVPNREYGDSIKKAFANMDTLLMEMNIENTELNQRAVRILGYNQMEISGEAIDRVKAYDQQVTYLMKNLHPAVTVRMIKEGINPLEMPLTELNQKIDSIKEEQGITSEEKFSTYLQRLEKEDSINTDERKAFIGIYRLLYNVEKSDGSALGSLIKAEREVTLEHLLSALQTGKKGRLDAVINDEFGSLQSISYKNETITEQLSLLSKGMGQQEPGRPTPEEDIAEQTQFLNRILKQMKEEISPEKLQELRKNITKAGEPGWASVSSSSSSRDVWDSIKEIPIERLFEQLKNVEATQSVENEFYTSKVQEIRELCKNSEQSIRFLQDLHIPSSPLNITLANHILSNGESPIKKLLKLNNEKVVENSEKSIKEISQLSDTLIDKNSMVEMYQQLEANSKEALNQACSEERIDSRRLAELKSLGQHMTFLKTLAEKEFYQIPIETDRGITNLNLTILRGTEASQRVSVTIWSEQLGNIKADFSLKDHILKGFFSSDNRGGLELLQQRAEEIEKAAKECEVTIKQMDFGVHRKESGTYSYQNSDNEVKNQTPSSDTERKLYQIAKAIVRTVRMAENGEVEINRAVS